MTLDRLPAGLFPVSFHLAYQHFSPPGFFHRFLVEGHSWLSGPWVLYPVGFLNEFLLVLVPQMLVIDFSFPPVYDRFTLGVDLREEGTLGLSGRLLHPRDLSGACWKSLPLGASLALGILYSCHLYLILVVLVLNSPSVSIHPFLVHSLASVISSFALWFPLMVQLYGVSPTAILSW